MTVIDFFGTFAAEVVPILASIAVVSSLFVKTFLDRKDSNEAERRLRQAESNAFPMRGLPVSSPDAELRHGGVDENALDPARLFDLYNKQIEKYQSDTQARAGWSFIFAIIAMVAGLSFVIWGGIHMLTGTSWKDVAGGGGIAAIGGAVGAFITKTFLNVHRLSLSQLNHYFQQPVVNSHILTAQRIVTLMSDDSARQAALQHLLMQVTTLIRGNSSPGSVWMSPAPPSAPTPPIRDGDQTT